MIAVAGIVFTFFMVFGGYMLAGGKFGIILKSLPFEMMMIIGAAVGAYALGNTFSRLKATISDIPKVFKGPCWTQADYMSLLKLLFQIVSLAKRNPVELEAHIDNPRQSTIFSDFPEILKDSEAIAIICDTLRASGMNYTDSVQIEELIDNKIDEKKHHQEISVHGLQSIADGLPALGIVAAVLGVIKTMGSIDQPPEILGKLIGGALVGTFLGVFLAYCIVAPFAAKMKSIADDDIAFYKAIKAALVAHFQSHPSKICIEIARQSVPCHLRPSFDVLDSSIR